MSGSSEGKTGKGEDVEGEPGEGRYKYAGFLAGKGQEPTGSKDFPLYSGIVSRYVAEILQSSRAGRRYAESSPSIMNAARMMGRPKRGSAAERDDALPA